MIRDLQWREHDAELPLVGPCCNSPRCYVSVCSQSAVSTIQKAASRFAVYALGVKAELRSSTYQGTSFDLVYFLDQSLRQKHLY